MSRVTRNRASSVLLILLLISCEYMQHGVLAKKLFGGSSRRTSSSSSSRTHRRPVLSSSNSGHVSKPAYSNSGLTLLSYAPSHSANVNHGSSRNTHTSNVHKHPQDSSSSKIHRGPVSSSSSLSSSNRGHDSKPAYSNLELTRLSYAPSHSANVNHGSSHNTHTAARPATASPNGSNVHKHPQGSPPAHSPHNPAGYGLPTGASYYPAGGVPHGDTYYPSAPAAPAALPAGATFIQPGGALPAGATYYAQPPKNVSGFGSGHIAKAYSTAKSFLQHAITLTQTSDEEHAPVSRSGYGKGGGGGSSGGDDKIIIINNGPPGSVTTSDVGSGTAVINSGVAQPAKTVPAVNAAAPSQLAPSAPAPQPAVAVSPVAAVAATNQTTPVASEAAPAPASAVPAPGTPAAPADPNTAPPPGGIICVPVRVPEPDPADPTKTIEVEKIACYPAPPPEPVAAATETANTAEGKPTSRTPTTASSEQSHGPPGSVTSKKGRYVSKYRLRRTGIKSTASAGAPVGRAPVREPGSATSTRDRLDRTDIKRAKAPGASVASVGKNAAPLQRDYPASGTAISLCTLIALLVTYCLH